MKKITYILLTLFFAGIIHANPESNYVVTYEDIAETERANQEVINALAGGGRHIVGGTIVDNRKAKKIVTELPDLLSQELDSKITSHFSNKEQAIGGIEKLWQPTFRFFIDGSDGMIQSKLGIFAPFVTSTGEILNIDGISIERAATSMLYLDILGGYSSRDGFNDDFGSGELSLGLGWRKLFGDVDAGQGWVGGLNLYLDGIYSSEVEGDELMGQASLGYEARTKNFSIYGNAYLPFEKYNDINNFCAPRLGTDIGVSAHFNFDNRLLFDADEIELELYLQGYYYADFDDIEELWGVVGGAELKIENDFYGMLPKYSRISPYIEGVYDSYSEDINARGGANLEIPFGAPSSLEKYTETQPRFHRAMRDASRRNLGFGGICKSLNQAPCDRDKVNALNPLFVSTNTSNPTVFIETIENLANQCVANGGIYTNIGTTDLNGTIVDFSFNITPSNEAYVSCFSANVASGAPGLPINLYFYGSGQSPECNQALGQRASVASCACPNDNVPILIFEADPT